DERFQIGRIAFAPDFDVERSDRAGISRVFVSVDGGSYFAKSSMQLRLALSRHRDLRQWHDGRRQDHDNRRDDDQFDERVPVGPVNQKARPLCLPHCTTHACTLHLERIYCCTMIVTGRNCKPIDVAPGPDPVPLNVSVTIPGATASNTTAASRPVPDAPIASAARVIVISTRPAVTTLLNVALAPPVGMKLPS